MSPATLIVYAAGLSMGLAMVSFPALSSILKQLQGLTDAQYGAIFLPQVAFAVIGSLLSGALARRLGLGLLLCLGLLANAASQALLAMSGGPADYPLLLLGITCLGLGFGLMAAPVNSYPALLFPAHRGSALVAMHTLIGLGFALGPLLLAQAITLNGWQGYPWLIAALSITLALAALTLPATTAAPEAASASVPNPGSLWGEPVFWVFAAIAMLYAFAEGTFANWAVIYLADAKKLDPAIAAYALSAFWLTLAVGRLIVSVLVLKIAPTLIWRALPLGMLAVFFMLPLADSAGVGILLFALAGLSCSAVFPLTIELASQRFALHGPQVGALLTAALMIGVGVGSYAVGLLRETVPLETLYSLSALYPALLWGLTWWAVRPGTGSKT